MKTIRIFISSPGDVAEERERAKQVIDSLKRRYAGVFHLKPVLWEELPLQADMSFQQGIDMVLSEEQGIDIAVFILWSRMGSPQGTMIRRPDGKVYQSGTEREFDLMLQAREQSGGERPSFLVYTRCDETSFEERLRGKPTSEKEDLIQQKKLVERFISEEFQESESGHNVRAYHSFDRPQAFSQRLRVHMIALLDSMAGGDIIDMVWNTDEQGPPFMGLEAFGDAQAAVFCGREDEVLEARRALVANARAGCAFLLITGASGSGKSSLARAGLLPAVQEQELDETVVEWRTLVTTPSELGADLVAELLERLAAPTLLPELRAEGVDFGDVIDSFRGGSSAAMILLKQAVAAASRKQSGGMRILLLMDQLEEVFSRVNGGDLLAVLEAMSRSGVLWVVATVRGDFMGEVHRNPVLARLMEGRSVISVLSPDADGLRRMIEEPARLAGLRFERRGERHLSDKILADASRHADLLPLVEFVLLRLYERRSSDGLLGWDVYEKELGGVEGALRRRADEVFDNLPAEVRNSLPQLLKRLVTLADASGGTDDGGERFIRQRVSLGEFQVGSPVQRLVVALVNERLLITTAGTGGQQEGTVTVAHEALLRVWSRAAAWAEGNRDLLRTLARVRARMGEEVSDVIVESDPLLKVANMHLAADAEAFSDAERCFIERSARIADDLRRRRERVRRAVMVGMSLLTLAALGGGGFAWIKQLEAKGQTERATEAEIATARQLTQTKRQLDRSHLEEGRAWFERARGASGEKNNLKALFFAGRALGFNGHSKESGDLESLPYSDLLADGFEDPETERERILELNNVQRFIGESPLSGLPIWRRRLGEELMAPVNSVALSPDGTILASGSWDSNIKLWSAATGELLRTLSGHSRNVTSVVFSSDGNRLASASADRTVMIWNVATGETERELKGHAQGVTGVAFNPEATILASVSTDRSIRLWDVSTGVVVATQRGGSFSCVAFSPDGKRVAGGALDGSVGVWGGASLEKVDLPLDNRSFGQIRSLAFCPNGAFIAAGKDDHTILLWNTTKGGEPVTLKGQGGGIRSLAFDSKGKVLASGGGGDGNLRLWDIGTGENTAIMRQLCKDIDYVNSVVFSPDGIRFFVGTMYNHIECWAVAGQEAATIRGDGGRIKSVAFSPNGKIIASGGSNIRLCEVETGAILSVLPGNADIVFSPNGLLLASGGRFGKVCIWDAINGSRLAEYEVGGSEISLAFSPDGKNLACGLSDGRFQLWNVASGEKQMERWGHKDYAAGVAFSPDGTRLATGSHDKSIKLWDASTGKLINELRGHQDGVESVAFSPDGKTLASCELVRETGIKLWDVKSGKEIFTLNKHGYCVKSVAFSPDGSILASGSSDRTVRIYDRLTGKQLAVLRGHKGEVESISFSPDGMLLASGSLDGRLRIWELSRILQYSKITNAQQTAPRLLELERQGFVYFKDREVFWNYDNTGDLGNQTTKPIQWQNDLLAQLAAAQNEELRLIIRLRLASCGRQWRAMSFLWRKAQESGVAATPELRHEFVIRAAVVARDLAVADNPQFPEILWTPLIEALHTDDWKDPCFSLAMMEASSGLLRRTGQAPQLAGKLKASVSTVAESSWLKALEHSVNTR